MNTTGQQSVFYLILYTVFNVMRNASVRVLLLLVSSGYGFKGEYVFQNQRVSTITFLYVILSIFYIAITYVDYEKPISIYWQLIALLPITVINAIIMYWTFTGIWKTRLELIRDKQKIKQQLLTKLGIILAIAVALSIIVLISELIFRWTHPRDQYWHSQWIFEIVWIALFTIVLFTIGIIFIPNSKSRLLAYGEELEEEKVHNPNSPDKHAEMIRELPPV